MITQLLVLFHLHANSMLIPWHRPGHHGPVLPPRLCSVHVLTDSTDWHRQKPKLNSRPNIAQYLNMMRRVVSSYYMNEAACPHLPDQPCYSAGSLMQRVLQSAVGT